MIKLDQNHYFTIHFSKLLIEMTRFTRYLFATLIKMTQCEIPFACNLSINCYERIIYADTRVLEKSIEYHQFKNWTVITYIKVACLEKPYETNSLKNLNPSQPLILDNKFNYSALSKYFFKRHYEAILFHNLKEHWYKSTKKYI
jgi:hypothetical protein